MEWVETTGRTIAEALDAALDELGVDEDDVEYEVLEQPKSGFLGRLGSSEGGPNSVGAPGNPPVPGQPVCDCHALVALATVPLSAGNSASGNASVQVTPDKGAWRLDFHDVRWSVPGGMDVLFSVRATARRRDACPVVAGWSLAAAPGAADYRLHLLNEKGVPIGLEPAPKRPRTVDIQVWARRTQSR